MSARQSFTSKEVSWLKQLFAVMARGGDTTILRRAPEYAAVFRKIDTMDKAIEREQLKAVSEEPLN